MKHPRRAWSATLLAITLLCAGCQSPQQIQAQRQTRQTERNHGYALLYDLMSDEARVNQLLYIKSVNPTLKALVQQIAGTAGAARDKLQAFAKADAALNLKDMHLPVMETRTRAAIASATARALLFSGGVTLERRLILTQLSAMEYGQHLAAVLADADDNAQRRAFLRGLAQACAAHYDRLLQQLTVTQPHAKTSP